jgi:hypothetical protein
MGSETLTSSLIDRVAKLPSKLRNQIEACPAEGQGVQLLHRYFAEEEIFEILSEYLSWRNSMSTPNKDDVVERMAAFEKALSEKDIEFLVRMAQEPEPDKEEEK